MKTYIADEVRKNCLKYFKGDELATQVWMTKYCLKNREQQFVEDGPIARFQKIAEEIAEEGGTYGGKDLAYQNQVLDALLAGEILPGGSGISGIGNPFTISSLGNCFVISGNNEDSYGSILRNDEEIVQIAKRRGGIGLDISHLRPSNTLVSNAAGTSTGAVSFMHRFSNATREVAQNGRRGALMLSMSVNHPEILQFVSVKNDRTSVTGANISVRVDDEFMKAVECDGYYIQRFPVDIPANPKMDMTEGKTYVFADGTRTKVRARKIWDELVKMNHSSAEPGILFWDQIKRESPADCYPNYQTESTNPCGELPLSPYDSCRLLSVNSVPFVKNPFTKDATFDMKGFRKACRLATRMMDDIITLEIQRIKAIIAKIEADPESDATKMTELILWKKVLRATENGRRAGMSVIGHGDMLAMLGMKYDSDEAMKHVEQVHEVAMNYMYMESIELAKERGAFGDWNAKLEKDNPFLNRLWDHVKRDMSVHGRRNIALLTIPPSGSQSIILQQSSGIEPVFMLYYMRRRKVAEGEPYDFVDEVGDKWQNFPVIHHGFKKWIEATHPWKNADKCTEAELEELAKESPYAGATANEIDPVQKVRMQGMIQKYVDHSISVTHNLPEDVSLETVDALYMEAWKSGCKGCTIYRDGSRSGVLVSSDKDEKKSDEFDYSDAAKRPKEIKCDIFQPSIGGERYIVLVGLVNDKPYEVFALKKSDDITLPSTTKHGYLVKQKSGVYHLLNNAKTPIVEDITSKFEVPLWEAFTRMISMSLRHGANIDFVVEQLNKADGIITDYSKVIARQLKKYVKQPEEGQKCPSCGETLQVQGGCATCVNPECGEGSKCG